MIFLEFQKGGVLLVNFMALDAIPLTPLLILFVFSVLFIAIPSFSESLICAIDSVHRIQYFAVLHWVCPILRDVPSGFKSYTTHSMEGVQ